MCLRVQGHGCGALGRPQCYLAWEAAAQGVEPLLIFNIHVCVARACCPYALLLRFGQRPGALLPAGRSLALSLAAAAARAGFGAGVCCAERVTTLRLPGLRRTPPHRAALLVWLRRRSLIAAMQLSRESLGAERSVPRPVGLGRLKPHGAQ